MASTVHSKMGDKNLARGNSKTSAVGRSKVDGLARQYVGGSVGSAHRAARKSTH